MRLPLRLNGLGIRSRVELRDAAYAGAAAKALPALADRVTDTLSGSVQPGILNTPKIASISGQGSFDDNTYSLTSFLDNSRRGASLEASWQRMQLAAADAGAAAPTGGALAADPSQIGHGFPNTQHAVSIQLDRSRQRKLNEAMPSHSRASVVYSSCDSLSRAFLTCPSYEGGMTPAVFAESFARYLAAPSPACIPHVGRTLYVSGRRGAVDVYGDDLVAAATKGGMEAKFRHDVVRDLLTTSIRGAGGSATAENSRWIHPAIPSAALAAMAALAGTPRQVRPMVPDVTYVLDPADGERVVECKTIAYCPTYYAPGRSGVNKRARQVQAEYWSKARAQDRAFGLAQLAPGSGPSGANSTIGPIERQLNSVAPVCIAVVGGFGEGSEDLHGLIGGIARKAALTAHVRLGLEQHVAAGLIQQQLIRKLGTAFVRSHSLLLLARLQFIAPHAAQRCTSRAALGQVISYRQLEAAAARLPGGRGHGSSRHGGRGG